MVCVMVLLAACGDLADDGPTEDPPVVDVSSDDSIGESVQQRFELPIRSGAAPSVTSGIPHIQLDQTSSDEMISSLSTWAFSLEGVAEQPSRASLPGARALTVAPEFAVFAEAMIVGREFGHIHPNPNGGGSLHLRLDAAGGQEVIDKGWGEWHPFALDGTMPGMVMVYAPRSDEDLDVVKLIIEASARHAIVSEGG